jgi:hypothetical protein
MLLELKLTEENSQIQRCLNLKSIERKYSSPTPPRSPTLQVEEKDSQTSILSLEKSSHTPLEIQAQPAQNFSENKTQENVYSKAKSTFFSPPPTTNPMATTNSNTKLASNPKSSKSLKNSHKKVPSFKSAKRSGSVLGVSGRDRRDLLKNLNKIDLFIKPQHQMNQIPLQLKSKSIPKNKTFFNPNMQTPSVKYEDKKYTHNKTHSKSKEKVHEKDNNTNEELKQGNTEGTQFNFSPISQYSQQSPKSNKSHKSHKSHQSEKAETQKSNKSSKSEKCEKYKDSEESNEIELNEVNELNELNEINEVNEVNELNDLNVEFEDDYELHESDFEGSPQKSYQTNNNNRICDVKPRELSYRRDRVQSELDNQNSDHVFELRSQNEDEDGDDGEEDEEISQSEVDCESNEFDLRSSMYGSNDDQVPQEFDPCEQGAQKIKIPGVNSCKMGVFNVGQQFLKQELALYALKNRIIKINAQKRVQVMCSVY